MERRIQTLEAEVAEAETSLETAREEVERARGDLEAAEEAAREARGSAREARESAERGATDARSCEECLDALRALLAEIAALRERYQSLKAGDEIEVWEDSLGEIDGSQLWNGWWDSFKRFRDQAKSMAEIKGLTDAQLPSQFQGLWGWGGPVGVAVGYGAEAVSGAVIPTDTIKAVGELYRVFQALFDPNTALGARILMEQLGADDAPLAARAFNEFPQVLRAAVESFAKLQELRDLEEEIASLLEGWMRCLDALPPVPGMPEVDMDALCLQQCLDKLAELEALKRRLQELIWQVEACEPDGLEDMLHRTEALKSDLRSMIARMNRTREGLGLYLRAHRQHFQSRGCFISTAAFGTTLAPALDSLRWFRDSVLSRGRWGRMMVETYERHSPRIASGLVDEDAREKVRWYIGIAIRVVERRRLSGPVEGALLTSLAVLIYVWGTLRAWQLVSIGPRKG